MSNKSALADAAVTQVEWSLPAGSMTAIKLFGCITPLPPGYFLHTDNVSPELIAFNRLNHPFGTLRIRPYKPHREDLFDVVYEKRIGPLTVIRIISKEGVIRTRQTLTTIHDGQRMLSIVGHDEDWAEPMAKYCADNPLPP